MVASPPEGAVAASNELLILEMIERALVSVICFLGGD